MVGPRQTEISRQSSFLRTMIKNARRPVHAEHAVFFGLSAGAKLAKINDALLWLKYFFVSLASAEHCVG